MNCCKVVFKLQLKLIFVLALSCFGMQAFADDTISQPLPQKKQDNVAANDPVATVYQAQNQDSAFKLYLKQWFPNFDQTFKRFKLPKGRLVTRCCKQDFSSNKRLPWLEKFGITVYRNDEIYWQSY